MTSLRVGLLGLADDGAAQLSALLADPRLNLVCIADTDARRLADVADRTDAIIYEDCRSLIVGATREPLDLLFVALEPFQAVDLLPLAAQRGTPVFHKAPFARTVNEGKRLVGCFADSDIPLVVAQPWRYTVEPGSAPARSGPSELIRAASIVLRTADGTDGWRGDAARAGGGVLLNGAYEVVDEIVHTFGCPESVYAECSISVPPGSPKKYDTEDVVALTLRFTNERFASLFVCRGAAKRVSHTTWVTADRGNAAYSTPVDLSPEPRVESAEDSHDLTTAIAADIQEFVTTWIGGDGVFSSKAADHLLVLAVIEAAYLSAKTGAPESPRQFME